MLEDLHVVALDMRTGEPVWDHRIDTRSSEGARRGYHTRSAPLIAGNVVIQGESKAKLITVRADRETQIKINAMNETINGSNTTAEYAMIHFSLLLRPTSFSALPMSPM